MRTPSAVSYAPGCGCRVRCDLEATQGDRWTMDWCPLHKAAGDLLAACKDQRRIMHAQTALLVAYRVGRSPSGKILDILASRDSVEEQANAAILAAEAKP